MKAVEKLAPLAIIVIIISLVVAFQKPPTPEQAAENMHYREPEIHARLDAGELKQGADGYLIAESALSLAAYTARRENADRRIVFARIAQKKGVPIEQIAKYYALEELNDQAARMKKALVGHKD